MKLLMIYSNKFYYNPTIKSLERFETVNKDFEINNALIAFIHAEEKDENDINGIEKKLVKNLKWAAKKNNTNNIVLHSFAHLSESRANADATKKILDLAEFRLKNANYETHQTPFGYFLDLNIDAPGFSLARIFKSF